MDAAAPFAARGLETWVVACPEECDLSKFAHADVVAVNTESRHLDALTAAQRLEDAFQRVDGESFDWIIKKVDSTLRGNVVSETLALMRVTHKVDVVAAPAFPAQGRVMRGGEVFVHDVPLAETAFARDALSPALAMPLATAFEATDKRVRARLGSVSRLARDIEAMEVIVLDAETDAELDAILQTVMHLDTMPLLLGSAGLTAALARWMAPEGIALEIPAVVGRLLYVVGSRASSSREQAMALNNAGAKVIEAPNGRLAKDPVLVPGADLVLLALPGPGGRESDAAEVARMMARHALRLIGNGNAQAVIATGGDTAIAILRGSGNPALPVGGELMPGIAYARMLVGGRPLWLVTKAGGFGNPETLLEIGKRLRAAAPSLAHS